MHHEERIQRIGPRCVRVVEEILDLGEGRLPEACATVLWWDIVSVRLLQSERLRCMRKGRDDPLMERLHFLQSCGEELPLWR